jgi:hypothetical protein
MKGVCVNEAPVPNTKINCTSKQERKTCYNKNCCPHSKQAIHEYQQGWYRGQADLFEFSIININTNKSKLGFLH